MAFASCASSRASRARMRNGPRDRFARPVHSWVRPGQRLEQVPDPAVTTAQSALGAVGDVQAVVA